MTYGHRWASGGLDGQPKRAELAGLAGRAAWKLTRPIGGLADWTGFGCTGLRLAHTGPGQGKGAPGRAGQEAGLGWDEISQIEFVASKNDLGTDYSSRERGVRGYKKYSCKPDSQPAWPTTAVG